MNDTSEATRAAAPAPSSPSYYQRHIFFCLNERRAGSGQVRVNKAGCLDRCAAGPVAVVYPEAVWYSYVDTTDIDEIVESHLKHGRVVERLLTPPHLGR